MAINKRLIAGAPTGGGGACTTDTLQILGDSSCIAYYKMADATDESGSYSGTATNVDFNAEGKYGLAGKFNGSSSKIDIASTITGNNSFSVSFWLNPTANNITPFMMGSASTGQAFLTFVTGNTLNFGRGGDSQGYTTSNTIPNDTWTHIAVSSNAGSVTVYVNGVSNLTFSTTYNISSGGTFIGYASGYGQYFEGRIDQVRLFNKAINSTEVSTLYNEVQCATAITPSEHFNTVLWTNGVNQHQSPITGVGFQPDFVWIKSRTSGTNHVLTDSVRGATKTLESNTTDNEETVAQGLTAFNADGFALGNDDRFNPDQRNNVAWNWYAPTSETNNSGSNGATSQSIIKKNVAAGFSIVKYTGNETDQHKVYHGLGAIPQVIILKCTGATNPWYVYHQGVDESSPADFNLRLNTDDARQDSSTEFSDTPPTANLFTLGTTTGTNKNNTDYIAFVFAEKEGYSRFGSYVGTGSDSGNFVVTGFEVAFLLVKRTDANADWFIFDNKRKFGDTSLTNPFDGELRPNRNLAEDNFDAFNFTTNGFELANSGTNMNASGGKYLFMAFANDPDTSAPTKADSFEAKTYTGNGSSQNIVLSNGMKPDFTWIKNRNDTNPHALYDSVRGAGKILNSNTTGAQGGNFGDLLGSFNSNGFQVNRNYLTNTAFDTTNGLSNLTYASWNWKALDHDRNLATINQDGSITSLVSANPAAGFSIVRYNIGTQSSSQTIGHGLGATPKLIIDKIINNSGFGWTVYSEPTGTEKALTLNSDGAAVTYSDFCSVVNDKFMKSKYTSTSNTQHIAYCFGDITGHQKIGSYSGTGSAGNAQNTGFKPSFLLLKSTNQSSAWYIIDDKRDGSNPTAHYSKANTSDAEFSNSDGVKFENNGFSFEGSSFNNSSSYDWLYLAIA